MSTSRQVTIWCDSEDCGVWEQVCRRTNVEARKDVKAGGWRFRAGQDHCPSCVAREIAFYAEFRRDWEGEAMAQDEDGQCKDGVLWFWDSLLEAVVGDERLPPGALEWPAPKWLKKLDAGRS